MQGPFGLVWGDKNKRKNVFVANLKPVAAKLFVVFKFKAFAGFSFHFIGLSRLRSSTISKP